jgi:hypothetical protein
MFGRWNNSKTQTTLSYDKGKHFKYNQQLQTENVNVISRAKNNYVIEPILSLWYFYIISDNGPFGSKHVAYCKCSRFYDYLYLFNGLLLGPYDVWQMCGPNFGGKYCFWFLPFQKSDWPHFLHLPYNRNFNSSPTTSASNCTKFSHPEYRDIMFFRNVGLYICHTA